jgi:CBS domain containing-hemolysin-like protein
MPGDPLRIIIIIICLLGSFFFSASETALACCNRFKMQVKAQEGSKLASITLKVITKFDRALTAVLIGNNIVAILTSTFATMLFLSFFKEQLASGTISESVVSILSTIIISLVFYMFGDTLPKTIAIHIPDTISLIVSLPIYILTILLYPIVLIFELIAKLIDKIFKSKSVSEITEEDFENAVEKVMSDGIIEEEQNEIIQSALDFADTNVKEVFTPINKMFALDIKNLTNDKLHDILLTTNYSRIPIYYGNYDHFIGVLHVKSYLSAYLLDKNVTIRQTLTKPYYVSSNILLDDLFNGFKKHHTHLALVRDNNKKVIGMVTMEDVLEELVSDISEPSSMKGGK